MNGSVWSIVLAAGEGTRLRALTTDETGLSVPKQYCAFGSPNSLLSDAIDRAAAVSSRQRVVPIVAAAHRRWWERQLDGLLPQNVVVQPANRGTAAGILLPLLHIVRYDPEATVVVLPADHFVQREAVLQRAIAQALVSVARARSSLVLLGLRPEAPDPGLGWITSRAGLPGEPMRVRSFVEKPDATTARRLLRDGALVNTFIFAVSATTLLQLYGLAVPDLIDRFVRWVSSPAAWTATGLEALYDRLPMLDFSRDVVQSARVCSSLRVIEVSPCGWSDLGTPERVAESHARYGVRSATSSERMPSRLVDLAAAVA